MSQKFKCLSVLLFIFSLGAYAEGPTTEGMPTGWFAANRIYLKMSEDTLQTSTTWTFERSENGDFSVLLNENRNGEIRAGRLMMIGGQALLTKDLVLTDGTALAALDGPSLMLQPH